MEKLKRKTAIALLLSLMFCCFANTAQALDLKGVVLDVKDNEPLIGASVKVKDKAQGAATDIDGNFSILNVDPKATIVVSYVGYETQEVPVNGRSKITVLLKENTELLEEVVVVGYGTMDKKEVTSTVAHISSEDFLASSSLDPTMMIQGKVPGVSITNTGVGDPNNQASIQIRGVSSRSAGLGPLIVIDGVPGGNLTNLNPNDIASFDILKDGAAAAIYGTRGSNGVIVVTTKKGARDGAVHTSYIGSVTANVANHELKMLDAASYRELRAGAVNGVDLGGNDNWLDAVTRTGWGTSHTVSINGGNANTNYRATADYRVQNGVDRYSKREEFGGRASINHTTKGGLFTFSLNIAPRVIERKVASWDVFRNALEANPTTPIWDEARAQYTNFTGQTAGYNPVEMMALEDNSATTKLLETDATIKLNILPLFAKDNWPSQTLNTQVTVADHEDSNFNYWFRPSTSTLAQNNGYDGEGSRSYSKGFQRSLEWLVNYTGSFNDHNVKAMLGYSYQYSQYSGMNAENKDFPNNGLGSNNLGSGQWAVEEGHVGMGSYKNDCKLIAFFGRISYDWKGRYIATASLRHEGSSKFGANHKWGNFPAVSLGWRISEESFMRDFEWINELKIRGDYGETGNQDFGNYMSLNTMSGFGYYYYQGKYYQVWGPGKNVNPDLRWEKAKNWNVGIDFSLFSNRLSGSFNYYTRNQQDLLGDYDVSVPPYLFSSTFVNVGTMRNSGFEFDLRWNAVANRDFTYTIDFVGATMDNKFVNFSNSEYVGQDYYDMVGTEDPYPFHNLQRIEQGKRLGNFYMYRYAGIDEKGNWAIYDKDGNIKLASEGTEEDKAIVGNGLPKFTASMTHSFRYKNFDLSMFFRGAFGYDIFNIHDFYYGHQSFNGNVMEKAYTKYAALKGSQEVTDYYLEKGDYVKLDALTVGYTFNLNKRFLDSIRLTFTGKNLFTLTSYSGVDPSSFQTNGLTPGATGSRTYYPSCRQFIFGVQLDF